MEARSVLCDVRNEALYKNTFILIFQRLVLKVFSVHDDRFPDISVIQAKQKPNRKR